MSLTLGLSNCKAQGIVIMNFNRQIMKHRREVFHLLFESETDLTPISRHTFFPLLSQVDVRSILFAIGGIFTDVRCLPYALRNFSECFMYTEILQ
jgi:hypothetical protein